MYLLTETASPFALERWAAFFANFGQFAKGFFYTLGISIGALIVALLLGLIFGAMSSTHNKVLRGISRVYVEIFQNTPLLVQFVVVFYGISILTDGHVMIPISLWGSTQEPISLKLFVQVSRRFLKDKPKPLCLKDSPTLIPCVSSSCLKQSVLSCHR